MNRDRVRAERIYDQQTESRIRLLRQTQPCVPNHNPRPHSALCQITEILRVTRDSLDERIDLEEGPVLTRLRVTENSSGAEANCGDSLPCKPAIEGGEQLADWSGGMIVSLRNQPTSGILVLSAVRRRSMHEAVGRTVDGLYTIRA